MALVVEVASDPKHIFHAPGHSSNSVAVQVGQDRCDLGVILRLAVHLQQHAVAKAKSVGRSIQVGTRGQNKSLPRSWKQLRSSGKLDSDTIPLPLENG